MATRRELLTTAPAAGALLALGPSAFTAATVGRAEVTAAPGMLLAALDTGLDRSGFVFLSNFPSAGLDGPAEEVHL